MDTSIDHLNSDSGGFGLKDESNAEISILKRARDMDDELSATEPSTSVARCGPSDDVKMAQRLRSQTSDPEHAQSNDLEDHPKDLEQPNLEQHSYENTRQQDLLKIIRDKEDRLVEVKQSQVQIGLQAAKARREVKSLRQELEASQKGLLTFQATINRKQNEWEAKEVTLQKQLTEALTEVQSLKATNASLEAKLDNVDETSNVVALFTSIAAHAAAQHQIPQTETAVRQLQVTALNAIGSLSGAVLQTLLESKPEETNGRPA